MYWKLTLRRGTGLGEEGSEWVHRREEGRVFHEDLLSPLGMGQRVRRGHCRWFATELGMRLGAGLRGRGEDHQLGYLLLWLECCFEVLPPFFFSVKACDQGHASQINPFCSKLLLVVVFIPGVEIKLRPAAVRKAKDTRGKKADFHLSKELAVSHRILFQIKS